MILLLVAIIALCVFGFFLIRRSEPYEIGKLIGFCFSSIGSALLLMYFFMFFDYISAGHKAKIINREFGTEYTQKEVFYAEDVIDAIAEIKRTRVELNGDLMGKK